jgi:glutathione S-transferase
MITLFTFGPFFGLPDGSPFVTKTMLLLKIAGLEYRADRGGYRKAPKGKLPYIDDDGVIVADSTFIRAHIERKYSFDFDAGLTPEQKSIAWMAERTCEDHLYYAMLSLRWAERENFDKGPAQFFAAVPAPIRPIARRQIRGGIVKGLQFQGLGRHSRADIALLAGRDFRALAVLLGDKPYLMGENPCGADATIGAFVIGLLAPLFETPIRTALESHGNLVAYADRLKQKYFASQA